jgi:hypothetical protein
MRDEMAAKTLAVPYETITLSLCLHTSCTYYYTVIPLGLITFPEAKLMKGADFLMGCKTVSCLI